MRISTPVFYQRSVSSVLDKQGALSQQNQHLSSSKRVLSGADDPVAIATIQRLNQDISVGEQYIQNAEAAESANALEDTALEQVTNVLQRVRELTVSGSSDTYNDGDREIIATELENLRAELIGVANSKDGNGQYVFSGFESDTQPYQTNEFGAIEFHGDEGVSSFQVGRGIVVQGYDSGASIFSGIGEGNGTFISEIGTSNKGSGVISEGTIVDESSARDFINQDYTIAITSPTVADKPEYSVYGLNDTAVTGSANVKISEIDLNDASIGSVNPNGFYPETDSAVNISFAETINANEFEVLVNGVSSTPAVYDSSDTTTQTISVNGISIEVDGIPADQDQYTLTKYIEPTPYEEGQSITFNGIKTELKGNVENLDNFTLRQSGEKDIFATIQDTINALNIKGDDDNSSALRITALDSALLEIDSGMDNVSYMHTKVGTRLNTIDSQRETNLDFNLTNQSALSNIEDLDMAAAISEFQQQTSMLEVSQQTFMKMQSLTLFDLMR